MSIDLVSIATASTERQFREVAKEIEQTMENLAPKPTGAKQGKGSMATGATKASISTTWNGRFSAFIGPTTEYAKYAEEGRGPVTVKRKQYLRFRGSDGRWHYAKSVGPMQGWHFVKRTAEIYRAKYGG